MSLEKELWFLPSIEVNEPHKDTWDIAENKAKDTNSLTRAEITYFDAHKGFCREQIYAIGCGKANALYPQKGLFYLRTIMENSVDVKFMRFDSLKSFYIMPKDLVLQ